VRVTYPWPTKCRCGAPLEFSCYDVLDGRPAEGADYWCSNGGQENGPHDWGVIKYEDRVPVLHGVRS
jgi:hypothetical protein